MTQTLRVCLLAVLFGLFVRTFWVQLYRIPSDSMEPTLLAGDVILVNRHVFAPSPVPWLAQRTPRTGDLALFRAPAPWRDVFLKRVSRSDNAEAPRYFLTGDNAPVSLDSRRFGAVRARDLIGRPLLVVWSRGPSGPRWSRLGLRPR